MWGLLYFLVVRASLDAPINLQHENGGAGAPPIVAENGFASLSLYGLGLQGG
jgi:hypothetical protein